MIRKFQYLFFNPKCTHKNFLTKKLGHVHKSYKHKTLKQNISNLKYYNPTDVIHLNYLCKILKCRINVWLERKIIYSCGENYKTKINLEFVKNDSINSHIGHYELKGKKEPNIKEEKYPNNCMYDVIAVQTGIGSNVLRRTVTKEIRKDYKTKYLKNTLSYPKSLINITKYECMRGGAKYIGKSKKDAKRLLDLSNSGESHPDRKPGHPRGHASHPKATGLFDSVENYSKTRRKTGFLSRLDQDFVAHLVLKTNKAQESLDILNEMGKSSTQKTTTVRAKDLAVNENKLPKAQEWRYGKSINSPQRINNLVIVLKHFYNEYDNENADAFILTFYPTL